MKEFIGLKLIKGKEMLANEAMKVLERSIDITNADEIGNGYLVEYEDGYKSWLPKHIFEEAYKKSGYMSFSEAIFMLKRGKRMARLGWNGRGIFIELQLPDENSKMTHPYIFIDTTGLQTDNKHAPKNRVPWLASQTDMLAEDWCVVGD